tara:strand:- start:19 stop:222 length:204 start_codon:yes stop_codon:yes gene_type:complete
MTYANKGFQLVISQISRYKMAVPIRVTISGSNDDGDWVPANQQIGFFDDRIVDYLRFEFVRAQRKIL